MLNPISQMEAFKAAQEQEAIETAKAEARSLLIQHLEDISTPSAKAKRRAEISLMWAFRKHLRKPKVAEKQTLPTAAAYRKAYVAARKQALQLEEKLGSLVNNPAYKPNQKPRNAA
ncbi:TPA: hypothetical protein ACRN3P_002520 [Pseudomonas aeruginosa]